MDNTISEKTTRSEFISRHLGSNYKDIKAMCEFLGFDSLDEFVSSVVPATVRSKSSLGLSEFSSPLSEEEALLKLKSIASKNKVYRSFIGCGYYENYIPRVIQRSLFENPAWYTPYTPYQPEISQGRLEALLNFQTMIIDLTGLPVANASLLDESTAAAEAMMISFTAGNKGATQKKKFFVDECVYPQTLDLLKTRGDPFLIEIVSGDPEKFSFDETFFGAMVQYPNKNGHIINLKNFVDSAHAQDVLVTVAADILSLCLLQSPGEAGADIAMGSTQRFGIPLGYGGPHAGYLATKDELKRLIPGRIVGVSKDAQGNRALRLALQTREQHIRREKATSNICTAQVLLAVMAGMYAVYHGAEGVKNIALTVHEKTKRLGKFLVDSGFELVSDSFFDTLSVKIAEDKKNAIRTQALAAKINLRYEDSLVSLSLDEATTENDLRNIAALFSSKEFPTSSNATTGSNSNFQKRETSYLTHSVFNSYHTETEFLRYLKFLELKDYSLANGMIPLGSCTMKLNATSEMIPVGWEEFSRLHPFVPADQAQGYSELFKSLEKALCEVTGFSAVSLQPNSGSQGEFAGLMAIKRFHESRKESHRKICLIPQSAHGTNPASAVMAGMEVVTTKCDNNGNIDVEDIREKAALHKKDLSALMITYPSTHGVFEESVKTITQIIHENGGQVYLDGANLNAIVGLAKPFELGADVCHINLHKTFCIPHGGGGPGMGPIGVAAHLAPFLPSHVQLNSEKNPSESNAWAVCAAPFGSASILPISWMYIAMMGQEGLTTATKVALLNANYVAKKLSSSFPVLYTGQNGLSAHECILDLRSFKEFGVEVDDIAKRLIDYGFHAPTVSWPVAGTMMIEPTESESKYELDRFCNAMGEIFKEIQDVKEGRADKNNNPLKNSPHTAESIASNEWTYAYTREKAVFPLAELKTKKYWTPCGRIDAAYGDKNFFCSCS